MSIYGFQEFNLQCWLESVTVSAGVLGTNTVFSLLIEAVHTGNTEKNVSSIVVQLVKKSYPAPSIMFLRLQ